MKCIYLIRCDTNLRFSLFSPICENYRKERFGLIPTIKLVLLLQSEPTNKETQVTKTDFYLVK